MIELYIMINIKVVNNYVILQIINN